MTMWILNKCDHSNVSFLGFHCTNNKKKHSNTKLFDNLGWNWLSKDKSKTTLLHVESHHKSMRVTDRLNDKWTPQSMTSNQVTNNLRTQKPRIKSDRYKHTVQTRENPIHNITSIQFEIMFFMKQNGTIWYKIFKIPLFYYPKKNYLLYKYQILK